MHQTNYYNFCMARFLLTLVSVSFFLCAAPQNIKRPKLVVGIVVDQMRWDYLYRFYNRYDESGGFKRLLNQGFCHQLIRCGKAILREVARRMGRGVEFGWRAAGGFLPNLLTPPANAIAHI